MSISRLPGVYFEAAAPPVPEVLPRMDIPAFVGFAASGPLDVPMAIEDVNRFHEIFGRDQMLAWDVDRGEQAYAQLPPAVRAFFRNGGRRCWIVRVSGAAKSNQFMLPGLLQSTDRNLPQAAWAQARSEGSWSDDLMVNAILSFDPLAISSMEYSSDGYTVALPLQVASPVGVGDLLRLVFSDSQTDSPAGPNALAYFPIREVKILPPSDERPAQQTLLKGKTAYWFRPAAQSDFAELSPSSPPNSSSLVQLSVPQSATWLTQPQDIEVSPLSAFDFSVEENQFVLQTSRVVTDGIQAGSWLRLQFNPLTQPDDATALLFLVDTIRGVTNESVASPPGNSESVRIFASGIWWALDENKAAQRYTSQPQVDALELELWVRDAAGEIVRLANLGMAPDQSRYLGYLPTDTQLFTPSDKPDTPPGLELWNAVTHPRFPLAAPENSASPVVYLPLGVPSFPRDDFFQPSVPIVGSALERDGLASAVPGPGSSFSADLFLDPDLRNYSVPTLLTVAFHKQYQLQLAGETGPPGMPLVKMHSILPVDEVSMLALPDAIHRGWIPAAVQQTSFPAPQLLSISVADSNVTLVWSKVNDATSYTLQQSSDPQFSTLVGEWQEQTEQSQPVPQSKGCPGHNYFRVRANGNAGISPWSNTLADELPPQAFELCNPGTLQSPVMDQPVESHGRVTLSWSDVDSNVLYRLEVAEDPAFDFSEVIYQGPATTFEIWRIPTQTSYFRVSAMRGAELGPFSNTTVAKGEDGEIQWQMISTSSATNPSEDQLLLIHEAMLRLCAARADMVAVLSLPTGYQTDPALAYKDRLISALAPEETEHILSFGALYHPWLWIRDGADDPSNAIRSLVPDGTICGSIATRTINGGAWLAPANQILSGVVDVDPHLEEKAAALFFDGHINLLLQQSRGFLSLSSATLSTDTAVSEINVRRLLILLRRLALRDGMAFVFQPNDTSLQHLVRRRFDDILGNLFLLGAFAGDVQDDGFRVVTDSSVNPPEMIEQGRFVVELKIAPSLPLEFLIVRLIQTGGEILLTEEL